MYERLEIECTTSCARCKNKCLDYLKEYETKEIEELMQGDDRIAMKRVHGALRRR